jgi:O-antigen ligase
MARMMKRPADAHALPPRITQLTRAERLLMNVAWGLIVLGVMASPVFISMAGKDEFRLPKTLLLRGEGLVAIAVLLTGLLLRLIRFPDSFHSRPLAWLCSLIALWSVITTLTSTNWRVSLPSLTWSISAIAITALIAWCGADRSVTVINLVLVAAIVNAVLFLLQRFHLWNPFTFDSTIPETMIATALLGNPDDVGSYLVTPTIAAAALALIQPTRRVWAMVAFGVLFSATMAGPLTSIAATSTGLMVMLVLWRGRRAVLPLSALLAVILVAAVLYAPFSSRITQVIALVRSGNYNSAVSGRATPFLAAWEMAKDRPLLGMGPGCFAWQYYEYKLKVESKHPQLLTAYARTFNFGEAHNDHLQVLAETGLFGYVLFISALILLGRGSVVQMQKSPRAAFVSIVSLPLATALFVLTLAHFPLRLAAPLVTTIYVGVLAIIWTSKEVRA